MLLLLIEKLVLWKCMSHRQRNLLGILSEPVPKVETDDSGMDGEDSDSDDEDEGVAQG